MAIDATKISPRNQSALFDLYNKGYPEAGLTLALMFQHQASKAQKAWNSNNFIAYKRESEELFEQILQNKNASKDVKETASGLLRRELSWAISDRNFKKHSTIWRTKGNTWISAKRK